MKVLNVRVKLLSFLSVAVLMLLTHACGGIGATPKKQLTMMYSVYNSQYTQYMVATGYTMNEAGEWKKSFFPAYTEDEKRVLQKKKKILTEMYPLVKLYDSMVVGTVPYSSATEQELLNLVDQLSKLGGI